MSLGAGLGLAEFPFSDGRAFWSWIEYCEANGVDSIWQSDRMVSLDPHLECMSVMAALAGATQRIKFGMNVASVALRDPLLLAKQCATIDFLSGGRLLPAFGVGSPRSPDWQASGRASKGAGAIAEEALEVMARLWSESTVDYEGKFFRYQKASISPRPLQQPLPMWIGGSSAAALQRTARLGTGWQGGLETPQEIGPIVARIKALALAFGRDIDPDHFGIGIPFRFGAWEDPAVAGFAAAYEKRTGRDPRGSFAIGGAEAIVQRIAAYVAAGIAKFVLRPIGRGEREVMEQTRLLVAEVLPGVKALERNRART